MWTNAVHDVLLKKGGIFMRHFTASLLKRITAVTLGLTIIGGLSVATVPVLTEAGTLTVSAASTVTVNASSVTLYALSDWADEYISIPSSYATQFQLKVSGASNVTYSTGSSYLSVSDTGLITPKRVTTYTYSMGNGWAYTTSTPDPNQEPIRINQQINFGTYTVQVRADGQTFNVSVTLKDYANAYADKVMDDYIKENIKSGMTTYQKVDKIAQFSANHNYDYHYSSAVGMIVSGGADCWGSTDATITMAQKIGLQAWVRNGNRDAGSGSGHKNAMVSDGKECYEVEAGYSGTAPRYYYVRKRDCLFSTRNVTGGVEVYQYDGQKVPEVLTVPATIDGKTVVGIGEKFIQMSSEVKEVILPDTIQYIGSSAFNSCYNLTKINIPASVESIGTFAFTECRSLTNINVTGKTFQFFNGALYQGTTLICCPNKAITALKSGTTAIADYAFYYNRNITAITLPSTLKTMGEGAFGDCSNLTEVTFKTTKLTAIPDYCFTYTKLTYVIIPDSVTAIGTRAFDVSGNKADLTLVGKAGSIVETYANNNGHTFLDASKMLQNTSRVSMTYAVIGNSVRVITGASGGNAPYQYEMSYKYQTDNQYTKLSFVDSNSGTFKVTKTGCYVARVVVTDSNGVKAEKFFNITVKDAIKPTASLSASAIDPGKSVTVTASATGGYGGYQYALQYKAPNQTGWKTAVSSGTNTVMTFQPTQTGTYTLRVKVTDAKSKTGYTSLSLTVNEKPLSNTSTLSASAITLGSSVTVNGSADGGTAPYQYALAYKTSGNSSYQSVKSYSTTAKMTFKPSAVDTYTLRVSVKDSKNTVKTRYLKLTVNPNPLSNTSTLSASSITIGQTVTVTGKATGGTAPYQYALYYKSSTDTSYKTASALGTTAARTFKPTKMDTYTLRMKVTDANGKTAYKNFSLTVKPKTLTNNSTLSAKSITLGQSVTVTGKASGGYGNYRYALDYKAPGASDWKSAVAFGTATKMVFKPTQKGTYVLRIIIKDAQSNTAYQFVNVTVS